MRLKKWQLISRIINTIILLMGLMGQVYAQYSANLCVEESQISTSSIYSGTTASEKLIDNYPKTGWLSSATVISAAQPQYVQYDFRTNPRVIVQYTMSARQYSSTNDAAKHPKSWYLMASNNKIQWDTLDRQTNQSWNIFLPEKKIFIIANTQQYRYYALVIIETNYVGSAYTVLGELEMMCPEDDARTNYMNKRSNIWYFGDSAGIDFNVEPPKALTNSAMLTREGCAAICDVNGNLLFYTNGTTVWNKNHFQMDNGYGLMDVIASATEPPHSTQSGVVVPHPGNTNLYYIFSTPCNWLTPNEKKYFRYALVDMSYNGGLGKVIEKNKLLGSYISSEKITAVAHQDNQSIWVINKETYTSKFYAYKVSTAGIDVNPVISNVGFTSTTIDCQCGVMKASPRGNKIAAAYWCNGSESCFELYDFDNRTGIVSNALNLGYPNGVRASAYGIEFSSNGQLLYGTTHMGYKIYQWNLQAGTLSGIKNSCTLIGTSLRYPGALQIAPNGKIYVALSIDGNQGNDRIGIIESPEVKGASCQYKDNGLFLNGKLSRQGFPNYIQSFFYNRSIGIERFCYGDTTIFKLLNMEGVDSVCWHFGNGNYKISTDSIYRYIYPQMGSYKVQAIQYLTNGTTDSIEQTITIKDCSCSTGTLLYKEDFGGNKLSDPWLKTTQIPEVTALTFLSDGKFGVTGVYSIRKRSAGSNQWYYYYSDHTYPNDTTRGYMLQIDGSSSTSGQFYGCRIDSLCSGSELYLSLWGMSSVKTSGWEHAYLKMVIEDSLGNLLTYKDITIYNQKGYWEQYGLNFQIPSGISTIVFRILNNTSNYGGNDFMLDDIEIRVCKPPVRVKVPSIPCSGDSYILSGEFENDGTIAEPIEYRWLYSLSGDMTKPNSWQEISSDSVLKFANITLSDSGFYRLAIATQGTINYKNCRAISDPVFVAVDSCPTIIPWVPVPIFKNIQGCDSVIYKNIIYRKDTLLSSVDTIPCTSVSCPDTILSISIHILKSTLFRIQDTICPGREYTQNGFHILSNQTLTSGHYMFQTIVSNMVGCDSLLILDLTVRTEQEQECHVMDTVFMTASICPETYYVFDRDTLRETGLYYRINGDTVFILNLGKTEIYANIEPEVPSICQGETILTARAPSGSIVQWNTGSYGDMIAVSDSGVYSLIVQNEGCMDTATVQIPGCKCKIKINNVFTPNNDQINDYFKPELENVIALEMYIYDRWGSLIFKTTGLDAFWDGTVKNGRACAVGVYYCIFKYRCKDATEQDEIKRTSVSLIR